jgi:hypothetical protein
MKTNTLTARLIVLMVILSLLIAVIPASAAPSTPKISVAPTYKSNVAFDVSKPLRSVAARPAPLAPQPFGAEPVDFRPDRGPVAVDTGFAGDGAVQSNMLSAKAMAAPYAMTTGANFEGISNQDNFNIFGFRVNPPDPDGDVGPNHYVSMVNLATAVWDKAGNLLMGPVDTGAFWAGFPIEDCTDPSGDPIVLYDQLSDRWLLSQFTTRGLPYYYNCVAISTTPDPTGSYYRYAFVTQEDGAGSGLYYFPDYPKYSVWNTSYILTTRDFGDAGGYGISVYALEKNKMVNGEAKVGVVQFFLDSAVVPLNFLGDGLLPADIDGNRKPLDHSWVPIVGTQDDNFPFYGATFDALNIFEMFVKWNSGTGPVAAMRLAAQLPVASFDSVFPCAPTSRDCLPQPGVTDPNRKLDILSYRQRPTFRLAYRNFGKMESMVTTQSVEAAPGVAGMRWYEIRRINGAYSLYQQGTYAPGDGVNRWMGSIAQDKFGNMALGYSVVNGVDVYPGIRYTGRTAASPMGMMDLGEGTIIDGTGVQLTTNSRWGDYTSMNVDPVDDCTFWYINEYYTAAGQASSLAGWQTRIASFKLPGCP